MHSHPRERIERARQHRGCAFTGVAMRNSVEAVATNPILLINPLGQGIAIGSRRHRLVEGGVEDGNVRDLGKQPLGLTNSHETPSIVNWSERNLYFDGPGNVVIDSSGFGESLAAVDDAVADRIGCEGRELAPRFRPGGLRIANAFDRSDCDFKVAFSLE